MGVIEKIKLKFFNDYSSYGWDYFFDKKGRKIWFFEDKNSAIKLILFHRGNTIGKMQYVFQEDHIILGDIVIFDDFPQFRRAGIGSWMFTKLKEFAKEHDFNYITGEMIPEKPELLPGLIKFYRTRGCEIKGKWFKFHL